MTGIVPKRVSTLPALPAGMDNASVATTFSMQPQTLSKLRVVVAACDIERYRTLIRSDKAKNRVRHSRVG
jgi:hypothetical protein